MVHRVRYYMHVYIYIHITIIGNNLCIYIHMSTYIIYNQYSISCRHKSIYTYTYTCIPYMYMIHVDMDIDIYLYRD